MLTFDELLHPVTPEQFRAEYQDRKPLYIATSPGARKDGVLDWAAFNALLNQSGRWTSHSLRIMRDHAAVPPSDYCESVQTSGGPALRPLPAKIQVFLATGASLVANEVERLHPSITAVAAALSETFAAQVGANVYCSFQNVQALGTHFDNHDVFAVQTEGRKVWNLYSNRADNPVDLPPDTQESRDWAQRTRGPLMTQVTMEPGDVLYLPRGWYHDAVASDGPSLHVTFSVAPLYGRILLQLLDNAAMQSSAFRAYLPPARQDGGVALQMRLKALGEYLAALAATPGFRDEVAMAQERLRIRPADFDLPNRTSLTFYEVTKAPFPATSTSASLVYEWAHSQGQFALEDLISQIDFVSAADVRNAISDAEKAGALRRLRV